MGEILKNKTTFELSDDLSDFFSLPLLDEPTYDYEKLKKKIFKSNNIDDEEKSNIINKINSLKNLKADYEKDKIIKEIEKFRREYKI